MSETDSYHNSWRQHKQLWWGVRLAADPVLQIENSADRASSNGTPSSDWAEAKCQSRWVSPRCQRGNAHPGSAGECTTNTGESSWGWRSGGGTSSGGGAAGQTGGHDGRGGWTPSRGWGCQKIPKNSQAKTDVHLRHTGTAILPAVGCRSKLLNATVSSPKSSQCCSPSILYTSTPILL